MNFKASEDISILNTLRFYYEQSGKEKETGQPLERWLYKADEIFRIDGQGQVTLWHFEALEEYFGVPALHYLFSRQEAYMPDCPLQETEGKLKQYLNNPFLRNRDIKMHIYDLRRMVAVMR